MAEGHRAGGKRAAIIAVCAAAVLAGVFGAYRLGRSAGPGGDIGEETAKSIALSHAAVSESDLSSYEIARDEAGSVYEVEFTTGSCSYAYVVNAATGSIVKFSREADEAAVPLPAEPKEEAPAPADSQVDEARAWEIAYGHAGVAAEDAAPSPAKLDYDDGAPIYELEFFSGGYEYDYEISAADGSVVKFEKEPDAQSAPPAQTSTASAPESPAPASAGGSAPQSGQSVQGELTADAVAYIGEARAKEIAYGHACLTADAVTHCGVELDHHGSGHHGGHGSHHGAGCCTYEIGFQSGGYEYEYRIDAITGEILGFEQEMHH